MHGKIAGVNKEAKTFDLDAEGVILVFELSAIRQVVKAAESKTEAVEAPVAEEVKAEEPASEDEK